MPPLHRFQEIRGRTNQFSHSFIPSVVALWNGLDGDVLAGKDLSFKCRVNNLLSLTLSTLASFNNNNKCILHGYLG